MTCDPNPGEPIQRSGVRVGGRSCSLSVRPPREIYGDIRQGLSRSVAAMACTTADLAANLTALDFRTNRTPARHAFRRLNASEPELRMCGAVGNRTTTGIRIHH